jgi:hypothetical protein
VVAEAVNVTLVEFPDPPFAGDIRLTVGAAAA